MTEALDLTSAERVEAENHALVALTPEPDRIAQQEALEMDLSARTRARFREQIDALRRQGHGAATPFGASVLGREVERLSEAVEAYLGRAEASGPGRKPVAASLLARIEPKVAAALALRRLVDRLTQPQGLVAAAGAIGAVLEDEARWRRLREEDAGAFAALARRERKRSARRASAPEPAAAWSAQERQLVGLRMIDLIIASTGLVEIRDERRGKRRVKRLHPSPEALDAISDSDAATAGLRPVFEPMVAPPLAWSDLHDGGYRTRHLPALPLVKTRRPETVKTLTPERAPDVFDAVNAAQATAWRINARVLDVLGALEADGVAAPGLAAAVPAARPLPSDDADQDRRAMARWRSEETVRRSRRAVVALARGAAERFRAFDRIYFPAQLDFRGRLYFAPAFNPQGPDLTRGLLSFAEAKPLGPEGWRWLAIHLCNCGDFGKMSKAPLDARVAWTVENEERILTVAADPLAERWWMEADAPWQFLAACFEWDGFRREGVAFGSRLPVAFDGSCSGLQHFSLALRDDEGGRAVNLGAALAPEARAADIYAEVALRTRRLIEADLRPARDNGARPRPIAEAMPESLSGAAEEGAIPVSELARRWLRFGVDRAVAKRPTMTYGYGARSFGFARMILEDTLAPAQAAWLARGAPEDDPRWPFEDHVFAAAVYLAGRLTEAIEQTVLKAAEAMRWLQQAASLAAAEGQPISWTTPDGFPVTQHYPAMTARRVKTTLGETVARLSLRVETAGLDKRRQRQGAAPNYVHALDACHLRMTVNQARRAGIDAFALVHDSFGTHAADSGRFFRIIREAMAELYQREDVVARFHQEIAAQLSPQARERLAPPPARGSLAVEAVLESDFCFA